MELVQRNEEWALMRALKKHRQEKEEMERISRRYGRSW